MSREMEHFVTSHEVWEYIHLRRHGKEERRGEERRGDARSREGRDL
jgi:hypothetical protein